MLHRLLHFTTKTNKELIDKMIREKLESGKLSFGDIVAYQSMTIQEMAARAQEMAARAQEKGVKAQEKAAYASFGGSLVQAAAFVLFGCYLYQREKDDKESQHKQQQDLELFKYARGIITGKEHTSHSKAMSDMYKYEIDMKKAEMDPLTLFRDVMKGKVSHGELRENKVYEMNNARAITKDHYLDMSFLYSELDKALDSTCKGEVMTLTCSYFVAVKEALNGRIKRRKELGKKYDDALDDE